LITKDELRHFRNLHENFARELQSALSLLVRNNVDITLVSADQALYNEFIISLSDITHIILFGMRPFPGVVILELNLALVFGLVDLLLGGKGDVETESRKLSEVELAITEPFVKTFLDQLQLALQKIAPVTAKFERIESSPEYVQAAPADAPMIVITFDVKIGLANGIVNLCYPMPMVQKMVEKISGLALQSDAYYGISEETSQQKNKIKEAAANIPLDLRVELGDARIRASDLLSLNPGDIILLNQKITEPAVVTIENEPIFFAKPVRKRNQLAVKLLRTISPYQALKLKQKAEE
ncbi:MAG: hypothetical protein D6820_08370, partial [Lentisphaerae bacterium]